MPKFGSSRNDLEGAAWTLVPRWSSGCCCSRCYLIATPTADHPQLSAGGCLPASIEKGEAFDRPAVAAAHGRHPEKKEGTTEQKLRLAQGSTRQERNCAPRILPRGEAQAGHGVIDFSRTPGPPPPTLRTPSLATAMLFIPHQPRVVVERYRMSTPRFLS